MLRELGRGERLRYLPEKLSGGEKQRVAIARSLVNDPAHVGASDRLYSVRQPTLRLRHRPDRL